MVRMLRLPLAKGTSLSLLIKSAAFGLLLAGFALINNPVFGYFVILLFGYFIYLSLPGERRLFRTSFFLTVVFAPVAVGLTAISIIPITILFWGFLALIDFKFPDRFLAYGILNISLLILVFAVFAALGGVWGLGYWGLIFFIVVWALFQEAIGFYGFKGRKRWLTAGVLSFATFQIFWFVQLLPLGVINSAVFMTVFMVLLREIMRSHIRGRLNRAFLLQQFTFLVVFWIIIFAASQWTV